jgi:uncharacterized protein (DUF1015 family)
MMAGAAAVASAAAVARVSPLTALHYDVARTGGLEPVVAPPYDVIDAAERAALLARSPYNVVAIDLPEDPQGGDPYAFAAATFAGWQKERIVVRDREPAIWALEQDYTGPDGRRRTRHGLLARVGVEDYGPGRIRPHERTHPGPKEDRLRLTRATHANLSPIFSLYDGDAWSPIATQLRSDAPFGTVTDEDGTIHRLWRVADRQAVSDAVAALAPAELLIADGHHRYETARVYAAESGAGHVLMCLVSLQDPGLTVFPTHRLLTNLDDARRQALRDAIARDWEITPIELDELEPEPAADGHVRLGYLDTFHHRPLRLTLKDSATAAAALPGKPEPYRRLDTAVTEALLLQGALGMSEDDISHLHGLDYARSTEQARARVLEGEVQAALFMGATPVGLVRDVAAAGEVMPPKSTYFFPKVLTGLVFNPLGDRPPG